jgi:hypothetical protein
MRSCKIIYGYVEKCLDDTTSPVLLIEPRSNIIDLVKKYIVNNKVSNITLISKGLTKSDSMVESLLYHNKDLDKYWVKSRDNNELCIRDNNELCIRDNNELCIRDNNVNVKKYSIYTTSLSNIIIQYEIQNVESIVINLNIDNYNDILENINQFNHIVSRILICKKNSETKLENSLFNNYNYNYNQEQDYLQYVHKNLKMELPSIALYFVNNTNVNNKEISLLVQQYKMSIFMNENENENENGLNDNVFVKYPESLKVVKNTSKISNSKIYHENVVNNLKFIFENVTKHNDISELDIILQFNPKYFNNKKTLQIMYPLKDNTIYTNRDFDIIYATKNCMYMMYQILKSNYFSDYISKKQSEKASLFRIFSKKYFYEYIEKIFIIKDF